MVAQVRGVHGLRGIVRVEPLTDDPSRFTVGSVFHREGDSEPLTVTWVQPDGPGYLVQFHEVTTRDRADALRDLYLEAKATARLQSDAYYWHEVVGATVSTADGEVLGQVTDIFRAGEAEVYVVRGGDRGEVLVPAVRSVMRTFEPRAGRIVVDAEALDLEAPRPPRPRGRRSTRTAAHAATDAGAAEPDGDAGR